MCASPSKTLSSGQPCRLIHGCQSCHGYDVMALLLEQLHTGFAFIVMKAMNPAILLWLESNYFDTLKQRKFCIVNVNNRFTCSTVYMVT